MVLIGSQLRPAGTGGIKTTTWQKVNQAWKQTVRYKIKSFYIPPFQFLFAARLTQTHLQRTRLLTSFMSACPSTQALSQTFMVKLFDLIKKKKKSAASLWKFTVWRAWEGYLPTTICLTNDQWETVNSVCVRVWRVGVFEGGTNSCFLFSSLLKMKKTTTLISLQSHE